MSDSELSDAPDAWLWKVMQKHKNREMIALLEDTLTSFVHDSQQTSLRFPPRNAFHRRVCYAVARRYQLAHKLEPIPDAHLPSSDALRLVLIKTSHSSIPTHRLAHFASLPPPPHPQQLSSAQQQQQSLSSDPSAHVDNCQADTSTNPTSNPSQQPLPSATPPTPARFLRRPTTANSKPARPRIPAVSSSLSSASAPALRSITEEDYQKARARIFQPSSTQTDNNANTNPQPLSRKQQQLSESHQSHQQSLENEFQRVVKLHPSSIAKGPVQGSTGFERRRNRRQSAPESNHRAESPQQPPASSTTAPRSSSTQSRQNSSHENSRTSSARTRTDSRSIDSRSSSNSSMTNPHSTTASTRRQSIYPPEPNSVDLQDPDFDRRYDKWAVRHPAPQQPAPQPIPVPIFSQLLYPYAVQAPHHVHPSNMHLPPASAPTQQPVTQYQSIVHHPSSTLMFHHAGRNGHEYESRVNAHANVSAGFSSTHAMDTGETAVATSQAFANHISASSIGAQVVQRASPAYGLDSTVDFPPLQ